MKRPIDSVETNGTSLLSLGEAKRRRIRSTAPLLMRRPTSVICSASFLDVLCMVFMELREDYEAREAIVCVCRHWRHLALSLPMMWSYLDLGIFLERNESYLNMMLERARGAVGYTLHLADGGLDEEEDISLSTETAYCRGLDFLVSHYHEIGSLTLLEDTEMDPNICVVEGIFSAAPALRLGFRELVLLGSMHEPFPGPKLNIATENAPRLSSLTVINRALDWASTVFCTLTVLEVYGDDTHSDFFDCDLASFLDAMRRCSGRLKELTLSYAAPPTSVYNAETISPIDFPRLEVLRLRDDLKQAPLLVQVIRPAPTCEVALTFSYGKELLDGKFHSYMGLDDSISSFMPRGLTYVQALEQTLLSEFIAHHGAVNKLESVTLVDTTPGFRAFFHRSGYRRDVQSLSIQLISIDDEYRLSDDPVCVPDAAVGLLRSHISRARSALCVKAEGNVGDLMWAWLIKETKVPHVLFQTSDISPAHVALWRSMSLSAFPHLQSLTRRFVEASAGRVHSDSQFGVGHDGAVPSHISEVEVLFDSKDEA